MKYSFYLFLVCLFFVSCNKSIRFASDAKDPLHFVDYSLLYKTPKFTPPDLAQPISLDDQSIDFIQLVSADVAALRLPASHPVDFTNKPKVEEHSFVRSEGMFMAPSIDMEANLVSNQNKEDEAIEWNLAKQEKRGLVVASLEKQQPRYPVSPELDLQVRIKGSNEDFVPESDLTLGGHEGFIPLAAADVAALRLPASHPVDFTNKPKVEEHSFVRSEGMFMAPSIDMEANLVSNQNKEDEAIEWNLAKQEKRELVVALTEGGQSHYPSSPLWVADTSEDDAPRELFIPRLLDILFVVDTSESMHEHLLSFKEKFMGFLRHFFNFNWKLAITNADHGEHGFFLFNLSTLKGKVMRLERDGSVMNLYYLDRTVEHYSQIFLDSISRHKLHEYQKHGRDGLEDVDYCELPPYCQGGNEQPLRSLKAALVKNQDFFRKNADLVVVLISNSKERASDYASGTQPEEVIEEFKSLYGEEKRFEVYGIIIPKDDEECLAQNNAGQFLVPEGDFSEKIARLSAVTGGETFSICSDNYEQLARSIFHSFGTNEEE